MAVDQRKRGLKRHANPLAESFGSGRYLDVLTRLPSMMASEAGQLTPANWLRARQGKAHRNAA